MSATRMTIVAPMSGEAVDITTVPDPAFAGKFLGDGFGVKPTSNEVVAPVSGTVTVTMPHALGVQTPEGFEVLLHLGIDTVQLNGAPFDLAVNQGDVITAGQYLGTMDLAQVVEAGKDTTALVLITNTDAELGSLSVELGPVERGAEVAVALPKGDAAGGAGEDASAEAAALGPADAAPAAASSAGGGVGPAAAGASEAPGSDPSNDGGATQASSAPAPAAAPASAAAPAGAAVAASASAAPSGAAVAATRDNSLTGFDALAQDIIENVGGADNVRSVIHCITRVRFYLKDEALANDEVVSNLDGVIDVAKAGGQYQVVIGPAVTDVYEAITKQLPQTGEGGPGPEVEEAPKPTTVGGWLKYGFSSLIGVITGSMIPIIGLLAAAGILKGILSLLTNFNVVTDESSTYMVINAMSDAVFLFLPIFVGFTAAKRLGSDPIIVAIIGGVLTYPTIIAAGTAPDGGWPASMTSILGMPINADFFGVPYHLANYGYSIFPIIVAAWLAARIEPWLKRVIPATLRMIFAPLLEVFIVSLAILLILGPIIMLLSGALAGGINWILSLNYPIAGLLIGGFYQCLVIFGLHWAVIPLVANEIAANGSSYLNAIISATMVAQGAGALAIFVKTKVLKIKELSGSATLAAFCGITEPAMYGLNLKYGRVFMMASIGGAAGGLLTGLFNVNMWGFTGALVGFTSFVNPEGLDMSFWGYLIASGTALVVGFVLVYFFGFKDSDLEVGKDVKKVRLGRREPAGA